MTGMIEWGKKSKPKKKSVGLQTKLKKIPRPKFNPQIKKSHAEFPSHKNFQKALNDITRRIETLAIPKKLPTSIKLPKKYLPKLEL